jgi:hypothetical protein
VSLRVRRFGSSLLALLLGLGLALALGELVLRALDVEPREYLTRAELSAYDFSPGSTTLYSGWLPSAVREFEVPVRINARGWRDREVPLEKPPGSVRILVLGDSYVEGKEVALERTFQERLEVALNAAAGSGGRGFEVVALGRGGYGTRRQAEVLRREGLAYAPDWVVLAFFPGNDVSDDSEPLSARQQRWAREVYGPVIVSARTDFLERMIWVRARL